MIKKMRAIEYNILMTIIKLFSDRLPDVANSYGIRNMSIPVLPSYPKNLTDMKKPSIIVRKVDMRQSKIGLGSVLGQYYDGDSNRYFDVMGKRHDIMLQFDIVAGNNTDRALFESILSDGIIDQIRYEENGRFPLYDFTYDYKNPEDMGHVTLIGDTSIRDINDPDSNNQEYIGIIRHNFSIIQTIIPNQEYVDLSKWIKQTYKIKL